MDTLGAPGEPEVNRTLKIRRAAARRAPVPLSRGRFRPGRRRTSERRHRRWASSPPPPPVERHPAHLVDLVVGLEPAVLVDGHRPVADDLVLAAGRRRSSTATSSAPRRHAQAGLLEHLAPSGVLVGLAAGRTCPSAGSSRRSGAGAPAAPRCRRRRRRATRPARRSHGGTAHLGHGRSRTARRSSQVDRGALPARVAAARGACRRCRAARPGATRRRSRAQARVSSARSTSRISSSRACSSGRSTGTSASTRRSRLRGIRSAEPM